MTYKINRILLALWLLLPLSAFAQMSPSEIAEASDDGFNFLIITDQGRNGYYDQKAIAQSMGELAGNGDAEFVLTLGDNFHYIGLESTSDPLWLTNFELVYDHPELQIPWYPIIGNHEQKGNVQAMIDYSKISRRWEMPARYYSLCFTTDEGENVELFMLDTCPLIDKYRNDPEYRSVQGESREEQLAWLEKSLAKSKADYKIVAGHHPVYAETKKSETERLDMQKYVQPLLEKYGVDLYLSGHIHNHQHIRPRGSSVDYVVVSSGALSRKVKPIEGTQFCSPETGFAFISIKNGKLTMYLLDKEGNELYRISRTKSHSSSKR